MADQSETPESRLEDIGRRIARIRLGLGMSQLRLAEETGISERNIRRLEAGQNTSLDTFLRVLSALGMGDRLSNMLPDPSVRPVERVRGKGHERRRIREKSTVPPATQWAWGDEDDA